MMILRMFDVMDSACEKANDTLGSSIRFPRPSKRHLKHTQVLNVTTGVACIMVGMVTPYKKVALLGGLSLLGAGFVGSQLKHFD